ncbi:hypothetical protein GGR44_003069 [Sphingobium fontiphilum]|uniref:DUF192 domain-containing protein n=1 Tax=Sphingobium fontiphilum TaxID=944425 RepID=A0A7W6DL32_9SPHN|nr:DUF192 domain-containing protein [Sphingobium fontiphilum]MBB3983381.1 hypothetical protein [Sphingobium fontiphilum]
MRRFILPLLLLSPVACTPAAKAPAEARNEQAGSVVGATIPLVVRTAQGEHRFDMEVAATPQDQQKGLMFRKELPPNRGMVFPMVPPRTASFWMKDTLIPLDMLFVRTDGSIALVATAQPYDLTPVSAGIPVAAVVEIAGGRAAELGIREGDKLRWGGCAAPGSPATAINFCPES